MVSFNNKLRQILFLGLIIILGVLLASQLTVFFPGLLGGVTLFILSREWYYKLVFKKKWKKGWTALLFIIGYIVIIALPVFFAVKMISPRVNSIMHNQQQVIDGLKTFSHSVAQRTGVEILTADKIQSLAAKVSAFIPSIINSTANIIVNLIMMFFLFYYLLVSGKGIEKFSAGFIPLEPENIRKLAKETKTLVKANALGIPLISIIQGSVAAVGYWIFGVADWGMWGFVTGVFAFFPVVGTMIIWVPLVIYVYSTGQNLTATGLLLYSLLVTGNVDYIARMTLLKKLGDVHPMVTVLGVIVGLSLFGFVGLIFGPLLVSYFLIFTKIYMKEFGPFPNQTFKHDDGTIDSANEEVKK